LILQEGDQATSTPPYFPQFPQHALQLGHLCGEKPDTASLLTGFI